MNLKTRAIIKGLRTFIPSERRKYVASYSGGTIDAFYCYGVWMKHLTLLHQSSAKLVPTSFAEIGPGSSLGVGLAALLSGVENYFALDIVEYSNVEANLQVFEQLVQLFKARVGRPTKGWPDFDNQLNENHFPDHILTDEVLEKSLSEERIESIKQEIINPGSHPNQVSIQYVAPWYEADIIQEETVDLILSHSVLEHVDDLEMTYEAFSQWLKPGGIMTHQIDFESHGMSEAWNGYRTYSEFTWKVMAGKLSPLINRAPCSTHRTLMEQNGFEVISHLKNYRTDGINRKQLTSHWNDISEDDLACSGTFIQAQKIDKTLSIPEVVPLRRAA